ncbi:hypothetical protein SAMN06297387_13131 [Streptomyces zhaozhouensis]|uniref:Uncharacterized protein n=1 Tax=Streptomyces zhaozhouensis TaxID=1300267 RepID=A0A286E9C4_9ACTN|nr:hypothetical protein [Streptomyces zhaozhouensis]SOD67479.1 hypothetical protein SAMN06297387_13131 [Streptomyces zhaozhouensis]
MTDQQQGRWTADHLADASTRQMWLEQRLMAIQASAEGLMRLAQETEADLREMPLEGDRMGQARVRAWRTVHPLRSAYRHLRSASSAVQRFEARYVQVTEELPQRREIAASTRARRAAARRRRLELAAGNVERLADRQGATEQQSAGAGGGFLQKKAQ